MQDQLLQLLPADNPNEFIETLSDSICVLILKCDETKQDLTEHKPLLCNLAQMRSILKIAQAKAT
jgi:hypothetical protein